MHRKVKMQAIFWPQNLKGRRNPKDLACMREGPFKIHLKEVSWEDVDLVNLAQNRDR
jgi:hypothetical protein